MEKHCILPFLSFQKLSYATVNKIHRHHYFSQKLPYATVNTQASLFEGMPIFQRCQSVPECRLNIEETNQGSLGGN